MTIKVDHPADLLERLVTPSYEGGFGGTCYECPFSEGPFVNQWGTPPDEWNRVDNDPTEAYFRCNLPTRQPEGQTPTWGEYAPCTEQEWFDALLPMVQAEAREQGVRSCDHKLINARALYENERWLRKNNVPVDTGG